MDAPCLAAVARRSGFLLVRLPTSRKGSEKWGTPIDEKKSDAEERGQEP
jgi:hypothetical protein